MSVPPTRLARRVQLLLGSSFTRARHEVEIGHVHVNGQMAADPGMMVEAGDEVTHLPNLPRRRRSPTVPAISILHLDQDIVVVIKPAGVVVHPTIEEETDTVTARVGAEVEKRSGAHKRVLVVHRLDRDTSGVMVFALNHEAAKHLQAQLRIHSMERRYQALVNGDLPGAVEVDRAIGRPRPGARRAALVPGSGGREATTSFETLQRLGTATLVEATLGTGRTHQVRVHLSYLGHPLLGDAVYGDPRLDPVPVPRMALHAALLGLVHPRTGERLTFTSPFPADLAQALRVLRRRLTHELPIQPPSRPPAEPAATARRRPLRHSPRPGAAPAEPPRPRIASRRRPGRPPRPK